MRKILFVFISVLFFNPLYLAAGEVRSMSLSNALQLALERNLTILQLRRDVSIAEAQLNQAFADMVLPDASLSAGFTWLDPDTVNKGIVDGARVISNASFMGLTFPVTETVKLTNAYYDNWSLGLTVAKPLFMGMRLGNSYRLRQWNVELSRMKLRDKELEIEAQVRTSFYNLFLLQENIRLTLDMDKSLRERLSYTRANYNAGLVSDYDIIRADVQYKNNLPKISRVSNAYRTSVTAFRNLIGDNGPEEVRFIGSLVEATNIRVPALEREKALERALSNDINLRVIDITLETLILTRSIAEAGRYPQLSAFFSWKLDYKKTNTYDTERSWNGSWNTGLQLSVPLDDWLPVSRTANAALETGELIEKTRLSRRQLVEGITLQLDTLLLQVEESRDNIKSQSELVRQARRGYDIANERYRFGTSSSLEVTDAEVSYNQAQLTYLQSIYEYYSSVVRLSRMLDSFREEL